MKITTLRFRPVAVERQYGTVIAKEGGAARRTVTKSFFYFLSLTLREIPVGIAYAIWSGVGIVLISIVGAVLFKQHLDTPALIGIGLIIAGVVVMNVFSKSVSH